MSSPEKRTPLLFGKPSEWMALLLQSLRLTAEEKFEEAATLRDKAFEAAPTTAGTLTAGDLPAQPFTWIADADSRLGPVLEAIINGRYYWVPFARLREVRVEKPVDLRDLAWMPAHLTFANGGESVALLPTRYPGSERASDTRLVLARSTEWQEKPASTSLGLGQRLLATDQGEHALMDVRVIQLAGTEQDGTEQEGTDPAAGSESVATSA